MDGGFYAPVNTASKIYPRIRLCYVADSKERGDTLKSFLSQCLPESIGGDLAALWLLCGYGDEFHRGQF